MSDLITRLEESNGDYSTDEILDYIKSRQAVIEAAGRMEMAWDTGELECNVLNGRWWNALKDFKEAREALGASDE